MGVAERRRRDVNANPQGQSRFGFDRIETKPWIRDLKRFLDASRSPPRITSGAGFRLKTLCLR
jgi:hypothetical protein